MGRKAKIWTLYKRFYVRTALERGDSRALIAERLGVSLTSLSSAISNYRLDKPAKDWEASHG